MVAPEALSRRCLIGSAAASAIAGMLLGGCGGCGGAAGAGGRRSQEASVLFSQASEERDADALLLDAALALELRLGAAYGAIAARLGGTGGAAALVRRIAAQEAQHAQALSKAIEGLGGPPAPTSPTPVFRAPRTARAALELAHREENRAIAFYIDTLPKLSADNALRARIAAVLANEAQHLALLAQALGQAPAPSSLVQGQA